MADAIPEPPLPKPRSAAALAANPEVAAIEAGLAIAFGTIFLVGVVGWLLQLFGQTPGALFARVVLFSELATVAALAAFVIAWERMPLGSLRIGKPARIDFEFGLALIVMLLVVEVAAAYLIPVLYTSEAAFLSNWLVIPLPAVVPIALKLPWYSAAALIVLIVLAEELGARAYAYTRLERLTRSMVLAAGLALLIDVVAYAPLLGLDYTICFIPAELILMWFFVSERRLLPCIIGHLGFNLIPLILLGLHLPVLASPAHAVNPHFQRGAQLERDHDYRGALAEFDQALRDDPNSADAYGERGAVHGFLGQFDPAIKDLSEAIRRDPNQPRYFVNRSWTYRVRGDLPHALADINSAIDLDPKEPDYYDRRGYIYSLMGDHARAIADYTVWIEGEPHNPAAYQARSDEYRLTGDYAKALRDAESYIKLKPSDPYGYSMKGNIELQQHQYDEALADGRKMLELDPLNLQSAYSVAGIYKYMGRWDDEISLCRKIAADHPKEANAYACAAEGYYHKGDLASAVSAMDKAIGAHPEAAGLYLQRANLEILAGKAKPAQADLKKLAALLPNDPMANNQAAWILSTSSQPEMRDPQAAIAMARKACHLTSWKESQVIDTLAAAYASNGDFSEAVKWERYALKMAGPATPRPAVKGMRDRLALYENHTPYHEDLSDPLLTARPPP